MKDTKDNDRKTERQIEGDIMTGSETAALIRINMRTQRTAFMTDGQTALNLKPARDTVKRFKCFNSQI